MRISWVVAGAAVACAIAGVGAAWAQGGAEQPASAIPPERGGEVAVDRPWHVCPPTRPKGMRFYPEKAQRKRIEGMANIQCRFRPDGAAEACVWIDESVPGWGFGEAAQAMGCLFKVKAPGPEAGGGASQVVQIPLKFTLPR